METQWIQVTATIKSGYGVASGQGSHSPYPAGSIALQTPFFRDRGLDLSPYFPGTINLSIQPHRFQLTQPQYTFRQVAWFPDIPPEDFSFSRCQLETRHGDRAQGLIYYPHPDTKPDHFQDPSIIEVLAPFLPGLNPGDRLTLRLNPNEVEVTSTEDAHQSNT